MLIFFLLLTDLSIFDVNSALVLQTLFRTIFRKKLQDQHWRSTLVDFSLSNRTLRRCVESWLKSRDRSSSSKWTLSEVTQTTFVVGRLRAVAI